MNNMDNYEQYIGKYYKRDLGQIEECVFKILGYKNGYFTTNMYRLDFGHSVWEINNRLSPFFDSKNFSEITEEEYDRTKKLCIDPYVTEYDFEDESNVKQYQLIGNVRL